MYKIILAVSDDGFIADKNGKIPWYIPHDLKWFKMNTYNSSIIMGRNTWETFIKPLSHRKNMIISRSKLKCLNQFHSVASAKEYLKSNDGWIIGGRVAEEFYASGILFYLTYVHTNIKQGTKINIPNMKNIWRSQTFYKNGYHYTFTINIIL